MGDERYTQSNAPYGAAPDYGQPYDGQPYDGYAPAGDYRAYGDAQTTGFNRHQPSNSRRVANENPLKNGARRLGDAVSGLKRSAAAKMPAPSPRASRSVPHDDGDYLGDGSACRLCGSPVDRSQVRCPHCGAFVRPLYQQVPFWIAIVVAVALVVALTLLIGSCRSGGGSEAPVTPAATDDVPGSASTATPTDKSALTAAVASAQGMLDAQAASHSYTAASILNLQSAVNNANAVLQNDAATDEEIATAAQGVSDAMAALVNPLSDYPWPTYEDLTANLAAYIGQQVAVNGTTQNITTDENGLVTATLAMSGNAATSVYVQYYDNVPDGDMYVGRDFTAMGTVTGNWDGVPVIFADYIQTM